MRPDSTLRPEKPPRGLILSTGEDVPQGHSLRARLLVIEVDPSDVNLERLTLCQRDAVAGLYAQATAAFVRWLAPQYGEIIGCLPTERSALREAVIAAGVHPRTPGVIADLALGLRYFLRFAMSTGALEGDEAERLWQDAWRELLAVGAAQVGHQRVSDPAQRFVELLSAAIGSGQAHVAAANGSRPDRGTRGSCDFQPPTAWGWRTNSASGTTPQGARVGWLAGDDLYLDPEVSFATVQRLARDQGEGFAITGATLRKRLHEHGLLASIDETRNRLVVRQTLESRRRAVLHLRADALTPEDATHSAQRAQNSAEGGPTGPSGPFPGRPIPPLHESIASLSPTCDDSQANG